MGDEECNLVPIVSKSPSGASARGSGHNSTPEVISKEYQKVVEIENAGTSELALIDNNFSPIAANHH